MRSRCIGHKLQAAELARAQQMQPGHGWVSMPARHVRGLRANAYTNSELGVWRPEAGASA